VDSAAHLTLALTQLAKRAIEVKPWQTFIQTINLDHEHFAGRLVALDSYLEEWKTP